MNRILNAIVLMSILAASVMAQENPPIRNFLRIDSEICTGGQPTMEQLATLKAQGVKTIINLRPPAEHDGAQEEAKAKELGFRYFNIPVVFREPKEEQATEFLKLTDDPANRPAFLHCAAAVRVGAFWLIRRVLRDGWTFDAAQAEATKVGLLNAPHLVDFARQYIEKNKQK